MRELDRELPRLGESLLALAWGIWHKIMEKRLSKPQSRPLFPRHTEPRGLMRRVQRGIVETSRRIPLYLKEAASKGRVWSGLPALLSSVGQGGRRIAMRYALWAVYFFQQDAHLASRSMLSVRSSSDDPAFGGMRIEGVGMKTAIR